MYRFSNQSKENKAIDGFLSSRSRRPIGTSEPKGFDGRILRPQDNQLDNFSKPEGFRGRVSPQLVASGEYDNLASKRQRLSFAPKNMNLVPPTQTKHNKKRPRKVLKIFKRAILITVVAILLTGGYIFGKAWWSAHKIFQGGGTSIAFQENIDPHLLNGEGDGRVNILLLGKGGDGHEGGQLTDSIMIASLDPINKGVVLLSVPRDLWVSPDGLWSMKINEVYTQTKDKARYENPDNEAAAEAAGLSGISDAVEEYLGVPIHYYGIVEFTAFEEVVNTLGGISVTLPEEYYDGTMLVGNNYLNLPAGTQNLDGGMALAYARSRYCDGCNDFSRGEQQQTVLVGIKDKILSLGTYSNPIKVSQLLDVFGDRVQTNLSIDDMMRIYSFAKELDSANITHTDLAQGDEAVVRTGSVGNASVVYPIAGIDNYDEVRSFVRNKLKDGFIIKENPSIIVLNGSSESDLAQERANELEGYGYDIIQIADAPTIVTNTVIIDNTNGQKKYTLRYLEQRFGASSTTDLNGVDLSNYQADFIIIVAP